MNKKIIVISAFLLLTILFAFVYIKKSQIPLHCTLIQHYDFLTHKGETVAVNQIETKDLIMVVDSLNKDILDVNRESLGFISINIDKNEISFKTMYNQLMEDRIEINRTTGNIEGYGSISNENGELSFTYSGKCEPFKLNKKF